MKKEAEPEEGNTRTKKEKPAEEKKKEQGLVEAVLNGLGLGRLAEGLGKTKVFKKRFKEVNEEIEKNLKKEEEKEND